jgi:hypothetical protein
MRGGACKVIPGATDTGTPVFSVEVKRTYVIVPGRTVVRAEPDSPLLDSNHYYEPGDPLVKDRDAACRFRRRPRIQSYIVYHHPTRKSVGHFAAVRLRDGQFPFRRDAERFNGETFWALLKVFWEASTVSGRRVVAISDNVQYHRSKLHLVAQPAGSPVRFGLPTAV